MSDTRRRWHLAGSDTRRRWHLAGFACVTLAATLGSCATAVDVGGTGPVRTGTATQWQRLEPDRFAAAINRPGVALIDVRTPEEFRAGHLPRAVNIDVAAGDFTDRLAELDRTVSYALYCRTSHRSGVAAERMRSAGFAQVFDLNGGIARWAAEDRRITKRE